jgi:energy-coupling factor transport system ATP-binding protein
VTEALEFFGISRYREEHPYSLSLGLRKLVAVASVYAMHPHVIVLDEPTTGLDHIGVGRISKTVKQMNEEGRTIVIITHNMPFVAENAERVVVMAQGEIIADDSPRKVFTTMHEVMEKANLSPPQITELANRLSNFGFPKEILTPGEMSNALVWRLEHNG